MDKQFAEGFTDVEIGDIVEIKNKQGELYDIRFVQQVRDSIVFFQFRLKDSDWVGREDVKVIRKVD